MQMVYYIIPARKGSKGFPQKNRKLLQYTLANIPDRVLPRVIISTDDEQLIKQVSDTDVKVLKREACLATDNASTRDVLIDVANKLNFDDKDIFVLLYLTYPERTYDDISLALSFFQESNASSLLCRKNVMTHPYLCMFETQYHKGEQIVKHNEYRRQDYPIVFEISHFIGIFKVSELNNLNKNLYNENTIYHRINDNVIDVDSEEDLQRFINK